MQAILWDIEIQLNHPITAGRLDLVIIIKKKENLSSVDLAVPADHNARKNNK